MTTPNGYHKPHNQDGAYDDDDRDSDLDLDLHELDPQPASTERPKPGSRQPSSGRMSYDFGARIPLRNLRFGGRRRPRNEDAEDLEALVGEDEASTKHLSAGSSGLSADDDAPLLSHQNGELRKFSQAGLDGFGDHRNRSKGVWRYLPFMHRSTSIQLPSNAEEEPEDDHDPAAARHVTVGAKQPARFPANAISNAKYTPWSFLPRTLFNEFKFFFNMYFLLVALSQMLPALRIGYLSTYIAPLAFVLMITLGKEAFDDLNRRKRDREANSEPYKVLRFDTPAMAGGSVGSKKRKIRSISEKKKKKKKGKRRRTSTADERLQEADDEENSTQDVEAASLELVEVIKSSAQLKVGDVIVLEKDQRVPADVVILKSFSTDAATNEEEPERQPSEEALVDMGEGAVPVSPNLQRQSTQGRQLSNETTSSDPSGGGEAFIRTDQLDGETDWKLRLATPLAQSLPASEYVRLKITAGKPDKRVNDFVGTIELEAKQHRAYDPHVEAGQTQDQEAEAKSTPLNIDNTAWANTVLASSTTVHAVVIYTGPQTRAALSTSASRSKTGLLELEINSLVKILCILTAALSVILVAIHGFEERDGNKWYIAAMRFLILFSTIVPISLRVNLDMGKSVYAWFIHHDTGIPGTVVRTSTIPEDLGRIEYLLSDKTGTLTRNEMELRKVHVGTVSYGGDAMQEVISYVRQAFTFPEDAPSGSLFTPTAGINSLSGATRTRREIGLRVRDLVLSLALCHNVTPTTEEDESGQPKISYQASSPDEIAIVEWTESVGLRLQHRDRRRITLQFTDNDRTVVRVEVLNVFPFTSDSKRMGIIVRFIRNSFLSTDDDGEIVFFQKGADTVMTSIVAANDWLDEETGNMAREGLRTLVVGRKNLSAQQYAAFSAAYAEASLSLAGRDAALASVVKQHLENNLELLGVTGVEDKLQPKVKPSLELLRNAGIKIWMLTGDKVETARCVAVSSKLVSRGQTIHTIAGLKRRDAALDALSMLHNQTNAALLIDGQSLALYLSYHRDAFISIAVRLPAVIACRCSPTQKADIAHLIRAYTKKRIACIGDGGNDVSMIQAADVGVGIVGKEGKQASLAADFSITQFAHLTKLLVWHGRNSYRRSAKLAQFVMHRGLIISVCQTVFSIASKFEPIALYRDWLLVGYATIYTMMPVFSLTLDKDVDEGLANLYPELYRELTLGKSLSYKTFFIWVAISIYQGLIIQGGSELLVPSFSSTDPAALSDPNYTPSQPVLIINEICMVAAEITTWHWMMIASIVSTSMIYIGSVPFLGPEYFELGFVWSGGFIWRFAAVLAAALVPVWGGKVLRRWVRPPSYRKVRGV
ncbi:Putative P-type ATPase, HAD superfamily, P-type ATPase, transmembrane domain superfamily [Septoria linicola]|uniref:Phospholipid-transporting ATPase n=1 Tax=Septoria linicola TaxID=215465 RepID=A0A9Q9ATN8_9PEZI|nr:Putative P-type ATPase, HAD superfamily, P-type ATPase, transmembrane domain superfamily [Septoria linicola]